MQRCQQPSRKNDHGTFQYHECDLLVRKLAVKALAQLRDPEDRSDEDEERGGSQRAQERAEVQTVSEAREGGVEYSVAKRRYGSRQVAANMLSDAT